MNITPAPSNSTSRGGISVEFYIIHYSVIVVWSLIVIFGILGNFLTIVVLISPRLNNTSTTFYLIALAFIDILYLIASVGSQVYDMVFLFSGSKLRLMSKFSCISMSIMLYSLAYISVWLLVSVAIDRMIWVILPFRAKTICTRNIAKMVVTSLVIFFVLIDLHFIWTLRYEYSIRRPKCSMSKYSTFKAIFPYIDLAMINGIPFPVMLVTNILIILKLHQMERIRRRMKSNNSATAGPATTTTTNSNNNEDNRSPSKQNAPLKGTNRSTGRCNTNNFKRSTRKISRDKQTGSLTKMLLSVNIFFLISTTPLLIYNSLSNVFTRKKCFTVYSIGFCYGFEKLVYTLWYLNFAVHFLLYCMSGPKFRQEALSLLNNCFSLCGRRQRVIVPPYNSEAQKTMRNVENQNNDKSFLKVCEDRDGDSHNDRQSSSFA